MAVITSEDFEGGSNTAALTTSNTGLSAFNGAPTFTDANPFEGDLSMHVETGTSALCAGRVDVAATTTLFARFAFRVNDWPSGNTQISQLSGPDSSVNLADLRLTGSGTLHLRSATTAVWTASAALAEDTWYQVAWGVTDGAVSCDLYDDIGTLIASSGSRAFTGGALGRLYVGLNMSASGIDYQIDALVVDNATKPDPLGGGDPGDGSDPSPAYGLIDFEGQTPGQPVDVPTPWTFQGSNAACVAATAAAVHGNLGARWADGDNFSCLQYAPGSTPVVVDFYARLRQVGGNFVIGEARTAPSGGSPAAQIRIRANRTVDVRNAALVAVDTSTQALALDTAYRFAWHVTPASQTLRVYAADNPAPIFTLTGTTGGDIGVIRVGITAATANVAIDIDTIRLADQWLDPYGDHVPEPTLHTHFTVRDGTLQPLVALSATGDGPSPSGTWWSHYDQQARAGQPPDSNPNFDAFEWAMKDRMANPPTEPIGTFIRGYSGSNFPSTFQASSVSSAPSRGVGAMLNVKRPDWQGLANGDYDSTITSFFNSWPVGTFGSFTINHEPENDGPTPANPANPTYVSWASVNGPIWSQGIARTIAVAAPIIRNRGLDVKLGGCLMDFSWDTTRWQYWDWWNYVDPQYLDVVEFQLDAYAKTTNGNPPVGYDLIPRIMECYQHGLDAGINHLSLFETAVDRRERHGGDNMVGTDESVATWWESYGPAIEAIPGARMIGYFSIPTGPASGQAGIMGRGLDVFASICLNGRRP